jgi:hypothetical protein
MVVLNDGSGPSLPPERVAAARRRLHAEWGMPVDPEALASDGATLHATRLIIAARVLGRPDLEDALLRAFRVHAMAGGEMDRSTLEALAERHDAPRALLELAAGAEVEAAVRADMTAARRPSAVARALGRRLGGGGTRYSTPSYVYETPGARFELVGIHPFEAHEAVLANLAPELERHDSASSVAEALGWAGEPLATAELTALLGRTPDGVAESAGDQIRFREAGLDGYWHRA